MMAVKILCWISKSLDPLLPIRVHWNGKERKRLEYWNSRTEDSGTQGQRRQVLNMLRSNFNYCYFQECLFCYCAGQYWLKDHQLIVFK